MEARAGLYLGSEVNGPITNPETMSTNFLDVKSGATWATVWFLVAFVFLFVL